MYSASIEAVMSGVKQHLLGCGVSTGEVGLHYEMGWFDRSVFYVITIHQDAENNEKVFRRPRHPAVGRNDRFFAAKSLVLPVV